MKNRAHQLAIVLRKQKEHYETIINNLKMKRHFYLVVQSFLELRDYNSTSIIEAIFHDEDKDMQYHLVNKLNEHWRGSTDLIYALLYFYEKSDEPTQLKFDTFMNARIAEIERKTITYNNPGMIAPDENFGEITIQNVYSLTKEEIVAKCNSFNCEPLFLEGNLIHITAKNKFSFYNLSIALNIHIKKEFLQ